MNDQELRKWEEDRKRMKEFMAWWHADISRRNKEAWEIHLERNKDSIEAHERSEAKRKKDLKRMARIILFLMILWWTGIYLAKGVIQTFFTIFFIPYAWYVVFQHIF